VEWQKPISQWNQLNKNNMNRHIQQLLLLLVMTTGTLSLEAQMVILTPKENNVQDLHHIAVTVVGKPGAKTWLYINNQPADSGEIRIDGKYDFLNIEVPAGPVEIRTEALGAKKRIYKAVRHIHILGPPKKFIANRERIDLPADSQSIQQIKIDIQDAWGHLIPKLKTATVQIEKGTLIETDLDSSASGWQLLVKNSRLHFTVRSANEVGTENVIIEVNGLRAQIPVRYTTPLSPFILVGSLDASVSAFQSDPDDMDEPKFTLADITHTEGQIKDVPISGRLALYGKGSVLNKYQVTASYDSRRSRDNQLFRDLDPNLQYALYGDASILTYDAQTQSKFFGKIERNESFIQIGDFNTRMRTTEFAAYDRSFNGLLGQIHIKNHALTGFATLNDRKMELDEIRGEGISGYYFLTAGRITINSDKIRLETRDRYHPEKIITAEEKIRYQDYDINYVDGTLMFKQPIPSVDSNGNPVYIVAVYEYQDNADKSIIGGLRYEGRFTNKFKLGTTIIIEEKEPKNYMLYGLDATLPLFSWLRFNGEIAQTHSSDFLNGNQDNEQIGKAYKTQIKLSPLKAVELKGYYRKVDNAFVNPSQTGSQFEMGTEKYGASGSVKMGAIGTIKSEYYKQHNHVGTVNENEVQVVNTFYEYPINEKASVRMGYEDALREKTGNDSIEVDKYQSKMLKGQVSYNWNKQLTSLIEHEQNLTKAKNTIPTGTSIGLSYSLSNKVNLFLKERLIYSGTKRSQTIFGVDSRVSKHTQLSGKYEIGGASGEKLNRITIGLKNKWQVHQDVTLNLAFESTATMDSLEIPTPEHNAVSASVEYLPDKPWKSSLKLELAQDKIVKKCVIAIATEFKVLNGLSTITKLEHAGAKYLKTNNEVWNRGNYQLGVAYRPELNDRFNSVAKVQLITDKNTHVVPKARLDRLIGSFHGYWQIMNCLGLAGRFAVRRLLDEEIDYYNTSTLTTLYALRTEYDFLPRWSTNIDMRMVHMNPLNQSKYGLAADINYHLVKNMQVGIGYIFKQLDDPDFSYFE
jgi:hypothetical protein